MGHFSSSKLSPTGPSPGLLCRRYTVTLPAGLWIAAVSAVSATTGLPLNSQISPVSS